MQLEPQSGDTIATISTNKGEIKILLYADKTPQTVANFVGHAEDGNYNGTVFHRVMKDFMIQTGDFENNNGTGGYPHTGKDTVLEDEYASGLTHVYGAVSMANIGVPNTGGSQFFIVQKADGTSWLNGGHSVFGYVFEGMEVVEEIAATETDASDRPLEDIIMETVTISQF
ncbi:peptidylprolyl isomerase [Candidatus Peregrinibacteria bacterium HGW-Peregrinibacteria-1]|nr:MAG: peptidylprolyl isomerase [Candidatus Peregrinibacteria bacterium HGW-Peregrinibacteria-1]